jgi:predicted acetyltransferase
MAWLMRPDERWEGSFREALGELPERMENGFGWVREESLAEGFAAYAESLLRQENPAMRAPGLVLQSTFWLVEEDAFVGLVRLRHGLNESLLRHGGHIGYGIRPSMRGRGYGRLILRLALEEARKLGLERVLLTCNPDNVASRRVIEANGGVFEDEVEDQVEGAVRRTARFWIDLKTNQHP